MGAKIQRAFPGAEIELKGGGSGDFIVTCDGHELWNKRRMGDEFPDEDGLVTELRKRYG